MSTPDPQAHRSRPRRLMLVTVDLDELEDLEHLAEVAEVLRSRDAEAMALAAFRTHAGSLIPPQRQP